MFVALIRKDKDKAEKEKFEKLKAELMLAFSAPDSSYSEVSAQDVFDRNN